MIPIKPNNVTWTNEQWEAIYLTGKNILVSAGAGSGKTAVLTERIIEKLKSGISINKMIILTFTNAAAAEMKDRVRNSIEENLKDYPKLKDQLYLLDQAIITTFDSYSLYLVKKYHYLLGIDKNIGIIDNVILSLKKEEILDKILEKYYDNKEFLNLLDTFTEKDDTLIRNSLLNIYNKIDSICKKQEYLNSYIDKYYDDSFINEKINKYLELISDTRDVIQMLIESIKNIVDNEVLVDFICKIEDSLDDLNYAKKYEDFKKIMDIFKLPSMTTSKKVDPDEKEEIKGYYDKLKAYVNDLKELTSYNSINEIKEELLSTKDNANIMIKIITDLDNELSQFKKSINNYEFSDITRLAISLLENNEDIRLEIKNNTNEIMIDEYQDTNDIGEYFISLISNNNIYMVGDVKQSIYRFRNANPKIFIEKYNDYKNSDNGYALDLNKNFRSRKEVLENINLIFNHIMDEKIGGANYSDGHNMIYGNMKYIENGMTNQNYNLEIYDYNYKNSEYKKYYSKDELEVLMIAKDIKERIRKHEQVYNPKEKKLRDITYKDFAVLADRKTNFDLYKKIFDYEGIPIIIHKDEEFVYSNEIYVIKNILKLINILKNKDFTNINYPFISVARSYLFDYKDNDIFTSVTNKDIINNEIFKDLFNSLNKLVIKSKEESISSLLISIYKEFDMYSKSIKLSNINNINKKLDYIVTLASNLESLGYNLNDFINYFDNLFDKKIDIQYSDKKDTSSDSVNLMTIHRSKGLEYQMCYFPGLYKKFNKADLKDKFLFSYQFGIVLPIFKEGITNTIYKRLLSNEYLKEDISERLRVLYVALTRAREKIIMLDNINELDLTPLPFNNNVVNDLERMKYSSFEDIISSVEEYLNPYIVKKEEYLHKAYLHKKEIKLKEIDSCYQAFENKKIRIDVIKGNKENFSHKRLKIEKIDNELGLEIHEILEYLDFNNYEKDIANYCSDDFVKNKIMKLFDTPFMKNIKSKKIYKEYEFFDKDNQGIIDLVLEGDNDIFVVDYKLKDINKNYYNDQVKKYMDYLKTISNKNIKGYLYSILDEKYVQVK